MIAVRHEGLPVSQGKRENLERFADVARHRRENAHGQQSDTLLLRIFTWKARDRLLNSITDAIAEGEGNSCAHVAVAKSPLCDLRRVPSIRLPMGARVT